MWGCLHDGHFSTYLSSVPKPSSFLSSNSSQADAFMLERYTVPPQTNPGLPCYTFSHLSPELAESASVLGIPILQIPISFPAPQIGSSRSPGHSVVSFQADPLGLTASIKAAH